MNQKEIKDQMTDLVEVIRRDNKFYMILKSDDESREVYLDRANYIII